ncbi:protein phosphatase CheZ [Hwanghaeella sp.]|uniref:protein phosphatase CheZ n=1 Tax=Hwanghaeella sp. TaxID=2605943 RepID=UPI003CCB7683
MSKTVSDVDEEKLRAEVLGLFQYIQRFREEIAHMIQPDAENDKTRFQTISEQLDAIIAATEDATHVILEGMEQIDNVTTKLREVKDPSEVGPLCDELEQISMNTMESCTFQDITGQRVTKIVRSMQFVESRVDAMLEIWGRDEVQNLAKQSAEMADKREGDEALLNGPALESEQSISQADIDALFD